MSELSEEPPGTVIIGSANKRTYLYVCQSAERMEIERKSAHEQGIQDIRDFVFVLDGITFELTYEELKSALHKSNARDEAQHAADIKAASEAIVELATIHRCADLVRDMAKKYAIKNITDTDEEATDRKATAWQLSQAEVAIRALKSAPATDMVSMPREPTQAMTDAAREVSDRYPFKPSPDGIKLGYMQVSLLWRAMIAARSEK